MDARWKLLTPFQIPKFFMLDHKMPKIGDQLRAPIRLLHGLPQQEKKKFKSSNSYIEESAKRSYKVSHKK
jgi:hypothetical protein